MQRELFSSYCRASNAQSMEQLIDYFAILGGSDIPIDTTLSLEQVISEQILPNYLHFRHLIDSLYMHTKESKKILIRAAKGDRRVFSIIKKAHLNDSLGLKIIDELCRADILEYELSRESPVLKIDPKQKLKKALREHRISHKVYFKKPFIRFWYYFIAPYEKEVAEANFENTLKLYRRDKNSFTGHIFEQLCKLYMSEVLYRHGVIKCDSYWDRAVEIDILLNSARKGIAVAECKYTNTKINRSELSRLKHKCTLAKIEPQKLILFAKRGFSKELISNADENLLLIKADDLKPLC